MKRLDPVTETLLTVLYEADPDGDGLSADEIAPLLRARGGSCRHETVGKVRLRLTLLARPGFIEEVAGRPSEAKRFRVSVNGARYLRELP